MARWHCQLASAGPVPVAQTRSQAGTTGTVLPVIDRLRITGRQRYPLEPESRSQRLGLAGVADAAGSDSEAVPMTESVPLRVRAEPESAPPGLPLAVSPRRADPAGALPVSASANARAGRALPSESDSPSPSQGSRPPACQWAAVPGQLAGVAGWPGPTPSHPGGRRPANGSGPAAASGTATHWHDHHWHGRNGLGKLAPYTAGASGCHWQSPPVALRCHCSPGSPSHGATGTGSLSENQLPAECQ